MARSQTLGELGEALAAAYLRLLGCEVEASRVRLAGVEVDLVVRDGEARVLVEVKVRGRADFGGAVHAVDRVKCERLRRAALAIGQRAPGPVRIDVIAVDLESDGLRLRHIRSAVTGH
ncbi:MAG: YraN family protein [Candidatus Eisenbacteria bacterium]